MGSPLIQTPVVVLEPRYYFNLKHRSEKSKPIDGNSGSFVSIKASYHPEFALLNASDAPVVSDYAIIPTLGIRRNLGESFDFETGIGIGYSYTFAERAGYAEDKSGLEPNMHLRIGYHF